MLGGAISRANSLWHVSFGCIGLPGKTILSLSTSISASSSWWAPLRLSGESLYSWVSSDRFPGAETTQLRSTVQANAGERTPSQRKSPLNCGLFSGHFGGTFGFNPIYESGALSKLHLFVFCPIVDGSQARKPGWRLPRWMQCLTLWL
jgi:hypothetical protein